MKNYKVILILFIFLATILISELNASYYYTGDSVTDICISKDNFIYIAKNNDKIIKIDSDSNIIYEKQLPVNIGIVDIEIGTNGILYILCDYQRKVKLKGKSYFPKGERGLAILTLKNGSLNWLQHASSKDIIYGESMILDSRNNIYITGAIGTLNSKKRMTGYFGNITKRFSNGGLLSTSIFIAKLNSKGKYLWVQNSFGGGAGESLSVDGYNNIYIKIMNSGKTDFGKIIVQSICAHDLFIGKLSRKGDFKWLIRTHPYNQETKKFHWNIRSKTQTTDKKGNTYLSGSVDYDMEIAGTHIKSDNEFLAKIDTDGNFEFAIDLKQIIPRDIKIDSKGNLYLICFFFGKENIEFDNFKIEERGIYLLKIDSAKKVTRIHQVSAKKSFENDEYLSIDNEDNVYIAGEVKEKIFFIKMNKDGKIIWKKESI